jgi:hypothetical protein
MAKEKREHKSDTVILINKTEGHRCCPLVVAECAGAAPVTENFTVQPGINGALPREKWDLACKNPQFSKWVDGGDLYELSGDINEWVDDHAKAVIARTSDMDGLKYWRKKCTKPKIQKVLDTAIGAFESLYREVKRPTG